MADTDPLLPENTAQRRANEDMPRSARFTSPVHKKILDRAPGPPKDDSIKGPISFFNPTRANFELPTPGQATSTAGPSSSSSNKAATSTESQDNGDVQVEWRARDNRKGRHILVVPASHDKGEYPRLSNSAPAIAQGLWRMLTVWAWWDVSWWIAILFTIGSALFIVSSFFYWLPLADPSTEFPGESLVYGGVFAFVGATLFTIGGVLLIIEASNENQTGCFGWAVEHLFLTNNPTETEAQTQAANAHPLPELCGHHHNRSLKHSVHLQHPGSGRKWEWAPTWHELRFHYFREIGFLASFIMAMGAIIFYVSGIMALPGIVNNVPTPVLYGTYWLAYLVGGILFIVSSLLYVLETQQKWWLPAPVVLGWWIGAFNLVGSIGWTISASLGYCTASWCTYQGNLATLWASWAFLIGSLLLWYEALDKYPVHQAKKE